MGTLHGSEPARRGKYHEPWLMHGGKDMQPMLA